MPGVKSARYPPTHDIIIGMAHIFLMAEKIQKLTLAT